MSSSSAGTRVRQVRWHDPSDNIAAVTRLAGAEYLRAVLTKALPSPPLNEVLQFALIEVGDGSALFTAQIGEFMSNGLGTVHGGAIATLCDGAIGCAVHSTLLRGTGYSTVELSTRFLRPVRSDHGEIRCAATVVHRGRRTAVGRAQVTDAEGRLLAEATASCLLIPVEPAGKP